MNVLLLQLLAILFACPLVLAATWPKPGEAVVGFFGAAVCTFPFCLIFGWTQQGYNRRKTVRVWYWNGSVNCIADSTIHTGELGQCRWFYGDQTQATHPPREQLLSGGGPAILIEFPPECRTGERVMQHRHHPAGPVVVAVGFRDTTRQEWENLLLQSGAVHDQERETLPAPLSDQTSACLGILALPACVLAGIYGSKAIDHLLITFGVPRDIALAISFPFFVPGCIYLLAHLSLFMSMYKKRCAYTSEQRQVAVEAWRANWGWLKVPVLMLFYTWFPDRLKLTGKIIETVLNLLMAGLLALHIRVLLRDPPGGSPER